MKLLLTVASVLLLAGPGLAQRNQLQLIRVSEDNDAMNVRRAPTDREYTNGTRIEVLYTKTGKPRFPSNLLIPPGWQTGNCAQVPQRYE